MKKLQDIMGINPSVKYKQPVKVDQIQATDVHTNVTQFVEKLNKDKSNLHYRGFAKAVKEVDHKSKVPEGHTRFVCISDTHNKHEKINVPNGDVLLHAGDFTDMGEIEEVENFNRWIGTLPHKHKIVIAGNHELSFCPKLMAQATIARENNHFMRFDFLKDIPEKIWKNKKSRLSNCIYLEDEEVEVNGIRIYGSPWQPEFGRWGFNLFRGKELLEKWDKIPDGIDILMTHGPPAGKLDMVSFGVRTGCVDLLNTIQLRVQPKYHIFGHIHEDPGYVTDMWTKYINASSVDRHYVASRKPIVFDYPNPLNAELGVVYPSTL